MKVKWIGQVVSILFCLMSEALGIAGGLKERITHHRILFTIFVMAATGDISGADVARPPYVPVPTPVNTGQYLIGALMSPVWDVNQRPSAWHDIMGYPERTPLLGYYDEGDPEVTDWEILWALNHGISFFVVSWFRAHDNLGKPVESIYEHWINNGLRKAKYGNMFRYAIHWDNVNPIASSILSERDLFDNLLPYWIENHFRTKYYLKVDNKPLLFIFSPGKFISDLGGPERAKVAVAKMKETCCRAGFKGLILLGNEDFDPNTPHQDWAKIGFDYSFAYNWPSFTSLMPEKSAPASEMIAVQEKCWRTQELVGVIPNIITASMGWDSRPWRTDWQVPYQWQLSPNDYRTLLDVAKKDMTARLGQGLDAQMVLLDNWNEYGEGHYIAPTEGNGFKYLEAVFNTFAIDPQPLHEVVPKDVGLGPYDHRLNQIRTGISLPAPKDSEDGLVSNFEGAKLDSKFGAGWVISTDQMQGGQSRAEFKLVPDGAGDSAQSLQVSGVVVDCRLRWTDNHPSPGKTQASWAGILFSPGETIFAPTNLSSKKSISFWAKGDGGTYQIMLFMKSFGQFIPTKDFTVTKDWKYFSFKIKDFNGCDGSDMQGIFFGANNHIGPFSFQIDNVRFDR